MKREIKFRGISKDNGEWIYGYVVNNAEGGYSIVYDLYWDKIETLLDGDDVLEETIGQYTGIKDSNGKEIYEGDIIQSGDNIYEVVWRDGGIYLENKYNWVELALEYAIHGVTIIGNIYENKNLLDKENKEGE